MAELIKWAFSTAAVDGPTLSDSGTFTVDVYDKTSAVIEVGKFADIAILPDVSKAVTLVVIKADYYGTGPKFINYKQVDHDTTPVNLDAPIMMLGASASTFPKKLTTLRFTNDTDKPVTIEILIGRKEISQKP